MLVSLSKTLRCYLSYSVKFILRKTGNLYFCVTPKNRELISLVGSDHRDSELSTNIQCEKNNLSLFLIFQKSAKILAKKLYLWHTWSFKSKLQIIFAACYIALFLPDINNCFFNPCPFLLFSYFVFLFSPSLS